MKNKNQSISLSSGKGRGEAKEIPILFSTEMVKALLDGRKTMTRRVVKGFALQWLDDFTPEYVADSGNHLCPYGKPGDLLWVREMLYQEGELGLKYVAGNEWIDNDFIPENHNPYRNYAHCNIPSIHMPKWAARIWLQVEEIRIERLNDITEEDAVAEGIESWVEERLRTKPTHYRIYSDFDNPTDPAMYSSTAVCSYETLWQLINGKDSWDANPYVWVVKFKVLSTTGKPDLQLATGNLQPGKEVHHA